jgi:hypothetical protein
MVDRMGRVVDCTGYWTGRGRGRKGRKGRKDRKDRKD